MNTSLKSKTAGYVIERTAKRLKRSFQQTLTALEADITVDQWVLLNLILQRPGLSQQEIASATSKDRPTVTRILDRLESKQLAVRRVGEEDRRKFGIYATDSGIEKVNQLMPSVEQFRMAHFEGLEDKDVKDLLRIMEIINQNITSAQTVDYALL